MVKLSELQAFAPSEAYLCDYRAVGTLILVQKFLLVLSISEGEIWSKADEKRSRTDGNDLSLVAAP